MFASVTVSASSGAVVSNPISLNWRDGGPAMWQVTVSSSVGTGDFTVQYSLDDWTTPALVYASSNYNVGGVTVSASLTVWSGVSSSPYTTVPTSGAAAVHFTSSTLFPDGVSGVFPVAPAGLRISSTATSSNTLTLKVIQSDY